MAKKVVENVKYAIAKVTWGQREYFVGEFWEEEVSGHLWWKRTCSKKCPHYSFNPERAMKFDSEIIAKTWAKCQALGVVEIVTFVEVPVTKWVPRG